MLPTDQQTFQFAWRLIRPRQSAKASGMVSSVRGDAIPAPRMSSVAATMASQMGCTE